MRLGMKSLAPEPSNREFSRLPSTRVAKKPVHPIPQTARRSEALYTTKHYIVDGWEEHVTQKFINERTAFFLLPACLGATLLDQASTK